LPPADVAKTEEQEAEMATAVVQSAEEQPEEPAVENSPTEAAQSGQVAEPAEPLESLSAVEPSPVPSDAADELVDEDVPNENLAEGVSSPGNPPAELSESALQDLFAEDLQASGPENTEDEEQQALPPAAENEQAIETTDQTMQADASPVESDQGADSPLEPAEHLEPAPVDEKSQVSKDEAKDLIEKAETAATILARLKQTFLHAPEAANGVTSYFNARRAPLPGVAETGTPQLGTEWGMPEASHPLDFHSKAVPKVPEDGSLPGPETDPAAALLAQQFSSGMPFGALEQLFIFTTGDGRAIWSSPLMSRMLEAIIGEKMECVRQGIPRDVIFNCDLSQLLKRDGAISDAVWHAMEIREPTVVARAQKKLSRTCVRTFNLERDTVVALVLFYNNQKLENIAAQSASSGTRRFALPVSAGSPDSADPR
jgi:chemotaxis protein histidine kinase CheA